MAETSQLIQHVESFVDSSRSPTQQVASLDAIASLLKNDILTIDALVREMEMYLTTTDNVIRTRGVLLLAELLTCLPSKPLDSATMHSLIGFFTDRLADWKALRGALVGCLALLRRKSNAGVVTGTDAKAVAQSYLQNLQVQSLGQHDRKLCFELLECLLDRFPNAVAELGDVLVYAICESIDGEKDPQCLMLTFHIVEVLAQLFPDPTGPFASYAEELFDILGCYFPIHFTHQKGEDIDVKRDDLSRALMVRNLLSSAFSIKNSASQSKRTLYLFELEMAFSSTPLFEPFAIPLLLEKLSSALLLAKVDSLKYLSNSTLKYGADRMAKHAKAIWTSLKDAIYTSREEPILFLSSEYLDGVHCQENEIVKEALILLQRIILQNPELFISFIVADEDINTIINSIISFRSYYDIPLESKQKLHAVGCILYVTAKTSIASCNKVFESFFLRLMDSMGRLVRNPSGVCDSNDNYKSSEKLNFGVLYLCIELLAACKDLVVSYEELASKAVVSSHETWSSILNDFSQLLAGAFTSTLTMSKNAGIHDADIYTGVKGLLILATFPGGFSPISKSIFENILKKLTSIITSELNNTLLWRQALKALVSIGSFVEKHHEPEKSLIYMDIVVEKFVSLVSVDDFSMPISLKLEAICDIGATGLNFMLRIVQGLEEAISANLADVYTHGNMKSTDIVVQLLEYYSNKLLPWLHKTGGHEEVPLRFAINIWNLIDNSVSFSEKFEGKEVLDAIMEAMKLAVGSCSEKNQITILEKSQSVLSCSTSFPLTKSIPVNFPTQLESLQLTRDFDSFSCKDEWLLSLYASVIMAVRPQTRIPNLRVVLHMFMKALLKGHVPSAQALGSMVNKLPLKISEVEIPGDCTLEEVLGIIFNTNFCGSHYNSTIMGCSELGDPSETSLTNLSLGVINGGSVPVQAISGLAWIGKGLLMRGHERSKDIIMIFLKCLVSDGKIEALPPKQGSLEIKSDQDVLPSIKKSAADAFDILMSDSEVCLNRRFHAVIRPLYKQRFFSTVIPILLPSIIKSDSLITRYMLYRAFGHVVSNTPLVAILSEAKKLIPVILDGLSVLSEDVLDKDILYSLVLVLSGLLTDKNGQEAVMENAHIIINCLTGLVSYPYMMLDIVALRVVMVPRSLGNSVDIAAIVLLVRETVVQCLAALSRLPYTRIYPMRSQVLRAISKALDDPKRAVRQEAVRCRQVWASIA